MSDPETTSGEAEPDPFLAAVEEAIRAEAERIRTDGTLPEGFEEDIRSRFDAIAADPRALEREVARRGEAEAASVTEQESVPPPRATGAGAVSARAKALPTVARRTVGPPVRRAQRRVVVGMGGVLDGGSVRLWSLADRVERRAEGSRIDRAVARLSGSPRRGIAPSTPASIRFDAIGHLGDLELDQFLEDEIAPATGGPVLHVESGEGAFVARLVRLGLDAHGHDPHHHVNDDGPMGALEALARTPESSLAGLVLTGVTDRLTPARARVLARLGRQALASDGRLVIVSADPEAVEEDDPVAADLSGRRPLHSRTWCALLSELGYEATAARNGARGLAYAVSTRCPGG